MPLIQTHLVSTIIPVHNRPELLRSAVESVLAQTYRPIEVLISDDGSTDTTPEVGRALERAHPGVVRYLSSPQRGPGPAREAGRLKARGEFIQYLDSDDLLLPGKFEVQVDAFRRHAGAGVVYGRTRLETIEGVVLADPFKWTGRRIDALFPLLLVDRWWCTHTPLYRRSVCDAVGPWTNLRYSQDWEYDGRVGALGTRLVFCDVSVSVHRVHGGLRQTGAGKWLSPPDRLRLFRLLHRYATDAGVEVHSPEMQHFSRWVFHHARECGAAGDAAAAKGCWDLARRAAGHSAPWDVQLYGAAAGILGWSRIGNLARWGGVTLRRRPGRRTMKQAWMERT